MRNIANLPPTEDDLLAIQVFPGSVLVAAASGLLDLNELAADELARRGCDLSGQWVGFPEAKRLRSLRAEPVVEVAVMDRKLAEIAKEECFFDTLETRNSDSLDFRDVAVWCLRSALEAAYKAGAVDAQHVATASHPPISDAVVVHEGGMRQDDKSPN